VSARSLVIGLDGADLGVVRALGEDRLPTLHTLMRRGAYAALESVRPPATLPAWTTFLTGMDPGAHGVFDFTTRQGYQVRFTAGTVREVPTLFARLDALGLRCACISFPATYPPEPLSNGIFMSGWDAPVAFEADRSFVWPPALYDAIEARFGKPRFDDVDEFAADAEGWHQALPAKLIGRIEEKAALGRWLLERERWDLFALYFGESDTAAHHLWSLHEPDSPRRPAGWAPDPLALSGLGQVYVALDRAVGTLLEAAGGEAVELTILSDHGSGGSSDKVLYLNRALEEAGLLRSKPRGVRQALVSGAKGLALRALPPRLRERIFRFGGAVLPSRLESAARFGGIEMGRSLCFSEELNYFPSVWLNMKGREPEGLVAPAEREAVCRQVIAALEAIVDPFSGARVIKRVLRREALYEGPFVERAPDLILELNLDGDHSYNLMPSADAPPGTGSWRRLCEAERLGRKGRSLPGAHRALGLFIAAGPSVAEAGELEATIPDVSATLLARMGIAVPPDFAGRVLWEALMATAAEARTLPQVAARARKSPADEARLHARLRALGYVD